MTLLACGINHKTAPLAIREKVAFVEEALPNQLLKFASDTQINEAAILSTCNRTEIYCHSTDSAPIIDWLHEQQQLPAGTLTPYLYVHQGQEAVRHILRVSSGLDSMMLGEAEVFGQVKQAFSLAKTAGTLGVQLEHLSQYVFATTKLVRTQTAVGTYPISIASAAVELARHIFTDMTQINVLLIGAGETIELAVQHLIKSGVKQFSIANRTLANAKNLAEKIGGTALTLDHIAEYLPQADMVISAAGSPLPLLNKTTVERALQLRKQREIYLVDLAVPRNIEPAVGELTDVHLYTLDDLQSLVLENLQQRQQAAVHAEKIIDQQVTRYAQGLEALKTVPLICAYRAKALAMRDAELAKAQQLLQAGLTPQEVLRQLAHNLTNKLLHAPTVRLRQVAPENQPEAFKLIEKIFED